MAAILNSLFPNFCWNDPDFWHCFYTVVHVVMYHDPYMNILNTAIPETMAPEKKLLHSQHFQRDMKRLISKHLQGRGWKEKRANRVQTPTGSV